MKCVVVKAAKLFLNGDEKFGIADSRLDLEPVSDNALVLHEPFDILLSHLGDFIDIKVIKCFSNPSLLRNMVIQLRPAWALPK